MLFTIGRPLSVSAWLAAPLLFAVSVLGLTAIGGALLSASWQATLSSALWGAAAAVTAALAGGVAWRSPTQRAALAIPYPVTLLLAGLALDDVRVPTRWAGTLGVLAIAALLIFYQRRRTT
ncbi:hypothetical protein [Actinokineospora sp. HUAS TT18]|uniref:hypothetical protein n=1 Tax=Actinokineospora sp. HUAS TT18 TaxID=3447451 RepID=UPI003F5271F1